MEMIEAGPPGPNGAAASSNGGGDVVRHGLPRPAFIHPLPGHNSDGHNEEVRQRIWRSFFFSPFILF